MKTLIAISFALFVSVACQKKVEAPVVPPAASPTVEVVDQQKPAEDTAAVDDTERPNEVECQD
jgi:hypothetical protein